MLREQRLLADQRRTLARSSVVEQQSRLNFVKAEAPLRVAQAKARREAAEAAVPRNKQALLRAKADELREGQAFRRAEEIYKTPVAGLVVGGALSKDQLEQASRLWTLAKENVPLVEAEVTVAEKQSVAAAEEFNAVGQQTQAMVKTEELVLITRKAEEAATLQQYLTVESEVNRQENQFVAAPTAGTVFRVLANAEAGGQLVSAGQQLAMLVPDVAPTTLTDTDSPGIVAEVLIDGNDLPLVRKGDRAIVQFEGWAAVQFAAYPEAAAGTFEGRVYLVDPTSDGEGRFRVLIEPAPGADWPGDEFLRQGVRAQAWVLVKEVRLGYELWRLLNGFPPAREVKDKESRQILGLGPVEKK
jgi:biotin carboxyl carrier protein